jgi:hypothetical protein
MDEFKTCVEKLIDDQKIRDLVKEKKTNESVYGGSSIRKTNH